MQEKVFRPSLSHILFLGGVTTVCCLLANIFLGPDIEPLGWERAFKTLPKTTAAYGLFGYLLPALVAWALLFQRATISGDELRLLVFIPKTLHREDIIGFEDRKADISKQTFPFAFSSQTYLLTRDGGRHRIPNGLGGSALGAKNDIIRWAIEGPAPVERPVPTPPPVMAASAPQAAPAGFGSSKPAFGRRR